MKHIHLFLIIIISFSSCQSTSNPKKIEIGTISKIDVHSHYQHSRSYLPSFLKKWNMRSVLVDVAKEGPEGLSLIHI